MNTTTHNIYFSKLLERYNTSQSNLSHRIKRLELKTQKIGRNTFLTLNQLAKLDELDKFLKDSPGATIDEFIRSHESINDSSMSAKNQITTGLLANKSATPHKSIDDISMIHQSFIDTSMMHQPINDSSMVSQSAFTEKENEAKALMQRVRELEWQLQIEQEANQKKDDIITKLCYQNEELVEQLQIQDENAQNQLQNLRSTLDFFSQHVKIQKEQLETLNETVLDCEVKVATLKLWD